jgi:tyrosine-protein phosphatase YwqE
MGNLLGLTPYNERLRKLRRSIQKVLNPEAVKTTFHPLIETKIRDVLLDRFMHSPLDFRNHIQTMASSIMMKLAYGYEVTGDNDVMVDIARDGMRSFSEVSRTGVFLVEFLPARVSNYLHPFALLVSN